MAFMFKKDGRHYIAAKDGGRWIRRSTGCTREDDAKKVLRRVENRIADGSPPFDEARKREKREQTLREFVKEYLERKLDNGYNIDRDRQCFANLCAHFGENRLSEITRDGIEHYIEHRLKSKARPPTVWTEVKVFKAALNKAVDWKRLAENPARKVAVKDGTKPRRRLLSKHEIGRLLDGAGQVSQTLRDLIEVALNTGMRRGELLKMREADCDLNRKEIRIPDTKTGEARVVPMNARVQEVLSSRGMWHPDNADGKLFSIKNVNRPFRAALHKAGLRDVRFQDLRRIAVSYLGMCGVDLKTAMTIVGHKDPRMTMMVYAMVSDDHLRKAIQRLDFGAGTYTEHDAQFTRKTNADG